MAIFHGISDIANVNSFIVNSEFCRISKEEHEIKGCQGNQDNLYSGYQKKIMDLS